MTHCRHETLAEVVFDEDKLRIFVNLFHDNEHIFMIQHTIQVDMISYRFPKMNTLSDTPINIDIEVEGQVDALIELTYLCRIVTFKDKIVRAVVNGIKHEDGS